VMYAGRIVEASSAEQLFSEPEHPYTWGLLRSIPAMPPPAPDIVEARLAAGTAREPERVEDLVPIPGVPPSLIRPPSGCHFHPRCPYAEPDHAVIDPPLEPVPHAPGHDVACLLAGDRRRGLWQELRAGRTPGEALAAVGPQEVAP